MGTSCEDGWRSAEHIQIGEALRPVPPTLNDDDDDDGGGDGDDDDDDDDEDPMWSM